MLYNKNLRPIKANDTVKLFGYDNGIVDLAQEPYERRVTLLLMQALELLRGALDRAKPEDVLHGVSQGISANLCEALAAMAPSDVYATLRIGISWSPNRRKVPSAIPHRVTFSHTEFPFVREVGRRLRERIEPHRERVEGPVFSLQAEPAQLFEEFQGRVIIRALIMGRSARVRIVLKQAEYSRACDAHRDGHRIAVAGVLQRDPQAKVFDLLQPQGFQVLLD
jgi:hypothetical protein